MSEIAREHFYERINDAPHAARGFFESVAKHFERDNMVQPHYTDTNGEDLRLAIPGAVLGQKQRRNFATVHWQPSKQVIFARTYLTPDELVVLGFDNAIKPTSESEPLNSDVRLGETVWRFGARDFIRVLEMAKVKFVASRLG
jgi:hypothetical protein